jgi:hypothetical protein
MKVKVLAWLLTFALGAACWVGVVLLLKWVVTR